MTGRQVILETHSDHLVSRLRLRIAEDERDALLETIRFVYAEEIDGKTVYRAVPTTRYGSTKDWPRGFFDQTAAESQDILRAGIRKKRAEDCRSYTLVKTERWGFNTIPNLYTFGDSLPW